jgi:hypothetical protein
VSSWPPAKQTFTSAFDTGQGFLITESWTNSSPTVRCNALSAPSCGLK